ncbi:hypothetical protein Nos7107_0855 [Nostoc sp. PCC 7107]|nr:hypothetical protein Nos7107_0855 [Nostoc sp. PCC 7107]
MNNADIQPQLLIGRIFCKYAHLMENTQHSAIKQKPWFHEETRVLNLMSLKNLDSLPDMGLDNYF